MKLDRALRLFLGTLLVLAFIIAVAALIFITESALNVWDRLLAGPRPVLYAYVALLSLLVIAAAWLSVQLLVRRKPRRTTKTGSGAPTSADIERRLRDADAAGVDVSAARAELSELAARRAAGSINLCFFGEISSGKSSLIRALQPDADVDVDVVGGSTAEITHYRWRNEAGAQVLLTDVPGTAGLDEGFSDTAVAEARRADVVLFVCDGDLSRAEKASLRILLDSEKPVVLVLNKSDRYRADEQALVLERLLDHLQDSGGELARDRIVAVSAGGDVEVVEQLADGTERTTLRERDADIGVLVVAINRLLAGDLADIDRRREAAVFRLAAEELDRAEEAFRAQRSEQILRASTRRAVIGALAAVSPGTDVVIQGYVGTTMTRELCALYGIPPRDVDVESFLTLSESRAGKALPLALAVAGNALKAFPGLGTVAGGLVHAVAYGLIFDALGRSLVKTLKTHGKLMPETAAAEFEEIIGGHLESRVRQVAKIALDERADRD